MKTVKMTEGQIKTRTATRNDRKGGRSSSSKNQSEAETGEGLIYLTVLPRGTTSMMNVWVDYATN